MADIELDLLHRTMTRGFHGIVLERENLDQNALQSIEK